MTTIKSAGKEIAYVINDLDYWHKKEIIKSIIDNLNRESKQILENSVGVIV